MQELWRRIRTQWNLSDTFVIGTNTVAFFLFIANCWWESVTATYLAALVPLVLQSIRQRRSRDKTLSEALLFGALVGCLWPFGEWGVVHHLGWWGGYIAPGPKLLETPVYCILIGWLASSYCFYVGKRTAELGYSQWASGIVSGTTALFVGIMGENLFVAARMWTYDESILDWGAIPAFVPVSYGIAYGLLPALRRFPIIPRTLVFTIITLVISVGLGLATGFFPR